MSKNLLLRRYLKRLPDAFSAASMLPVNNKAPHLQQGEQSEQVACDYLLAQGLKLISRNYRCRYGELDLIMREQNTLVIVEVRFRKRDTYGSAAESITAQKQSRIIAATQSYLATNPLHSPLRFDVIALSGNQEIKWIKDAFQS